MVCSADDLVEWKDFPKGLRVLLLDEDNNSTAEIKLKLEEMDYIVSTFHNEDEALKAISNKCESFHVAIVEVSTGNSLGSFKFLENAKNLPTIMTSNIHCLSTMMKCIAHGAAEFLQKPLSEDKLKNIWQHVVHKAFNAGEDTLSESMKPVKETVASMLHLKLAEKQNENQKLLETVDVVTNSTYELCDHNNEQSMTTDKFPAPSTPQLKQGGRFSDDGDCQESTQDQSNCNSSMEKEHAEPADGERSKSVDTTCNNSSIDQPQVTITTTTTSSSNVVDDTLIIKEEKKSSSPAGPKTTESNLSSQMKTIDGVKDSNAESRNRKKQTSLHPNSCGSRANRKKMKVDWTTDLHKRFVQAVEQLGVDQAIPSRILELMKAEGLTRHNVASHLQKYRLNRRHILPKEDHHHHHHQERIRWQSSPSMQRTTTNYHHQNNKPVMAYPSLPLPYHHSLAHHHHQPVCHVWGHPAASNNHQMWGHHPGLPAWQHADSRIWKGHSAASYPTAAGGFQQMNVDGWGNPVNVMPTLSHHHQVPYATTYPQGHNVTGYAVEDHSSSMGNMISSFHLHPQEEDAADADDDDYEEKLVFIDKVVKEAMSKPWLPLPLGLNPPSTESVLNELQKQGIPNIPPPPQHQHQHQHHHHQY